MYKNRNRLKADAMDTIGDNKAAKRYRFMAEWFDEAIKREEGISREYGGLNDGIRKIRKG
jgi:hypothetical protein